MYFRTTYLHSACLAIALLSCAPLGTRPSDGDVERFSTSQHYNVEKKQFENRLPNVMEAMNRRVYSMDSFKAWMDGPEQGRPPGPLPTQQADIEAFSAPDGSLKIIWLGHSSFLLNMAGRIILVDPIFSQAASPVSLFVRRFQEPPIPLKALPPIDFILISHDHYDHLDMETTEFFVERETRFIALPGVKNHLTGWGIDAERVTEMDWWETAAFPEVTFIATPAQHFSGRDGIHPNETLWASWVVHSAEHKIYFSGDSGAISTFGRSETDTARSMWSSWTADNTMKDGARSTCFLARRCRQPTTYARHTTSPFIGACLSSPCTTGTTPSEG